MQITRKQALVLKKLSTTEILMGLFVNPGIRSFREKDLYSFLDKTGDFRFKTGGVGNIPGVRASLSFFEIGRMIYEADDRHHVAPGMKEAMEKELKERKVLPKYAETLKAVAESFLEMTR